MKNFVKALHKNGAAFQHLSTVFPGLSAAKLKEGIFVGPQIREVLKDTDFEELLNLKELRAWQMEPRHDGRLLLDALAWHPGGKIHQIF